MPRGVRGFRWIETGCKVWQLEDSPGYFPGVVRLIADDVYSWWVWNYGQGGECATKREAMAEVERRVIPRGKGDG